MSIDDVLFGLVGREGEDAGRGGVVRVVQALLGEGGAWTRVRMGFMV